MLLSTGSSWFCTTDTTVWASYLCILEETQPRNVRKKVISVISPSHRCSIMPFQTTVSVLVHLVLPLFFYHERYVNIHAGEVNDAFKWLSIAITKPRWRLRSEKGQSYRSCRSLRIFHSRLSSAARAPCERQALPCYSRVTSLLTAYLVFILPQAPMWVD